MTRRFKVALASVLLGVAVVMGALMASLLRQGLDKASLWASLLGLPLTVLIAVCGAWTVVLAAKEVHSSEVPGRSGPGSAPTTDARYLSRSGDIWQSHTGGSTVAHTGVGDINVTGPAVKEAATDDPA